MLVYLLNHPHLYVLHRDTNRRRKGQESHVNTELFFLSFNFQFKSLKIILLYFATQQLLLTIRSNQLVTMLLDHHVAVAKNEAFVVHIQSIDTIVCLPSGINVIQLPINLNIHTVNYFPQIKKLIILFIILCIRAVPLN